jgi:putative ABC transport system permease protein
MFSNHLKIALRNLVRHKGHSFINIFGLAIGAAACLMITLWAEDELAYDRFNEKADRIYRTVWNGRVGNNEWTIPPCPVPLADALVREVPEVETAVRMMQTQRAVRRGTEFILEKQIFYTEASFFDVFTVDVISGDPRAALNMPDRVVITQSAAQKYFPAGNPIGGTVEFDNGAKFTVGAVVAPFPERSHFQFDILAPIQTHPMFKQRQDQWGSATVYTYVLLKRAGDLPSVQSKLDHYLARTVLKDDFYKQGENHYRILFQSLPDLHLRSHLEYELEPGGNIVYLYLFGAIAIIIMLLACINFINLSTAHAARRTLEVGVRKVLGSQRGQLVRQFLVESGVYVGIAILAALLILELYLPAFNKLSGKHLSAGIVFHLHTLLILGAIAGSVVILSGAYPAFFLSSFLPVNALKRLGPGGRGQRWLRNTLVVAQFCVSITLIVGTIIVNDQLTFMQHTALGFQKEHVVVIHGVGTMGTRYSQFVSRLRSQPRIASASAAQSMPGTIFDSMPFEPEQPANYQLSSLSYAMVDESYVDVLGLKIVEGRNFSTNFPTDSSGYLINQSAAAAIGWDHPVGKHIGYGDGKPGTVVGVIEDFHIESLHHAIKPVVFPFIRWTPAYVAVRILPGDTRQSLAGIQDLWKEFVPQRPFEYSFLDQDYDALYRTEERVADVFGTFTVLAIVIACLGLFGLAAYTVERRTKEIGVRKILGASVSQIVIMLGSEFARLVLAAGLVAVPIAYVAMHAWLQDFAYKVEIGIGTFLFAGVLAMAIAFVTISYKAVKAGMTNPARALRYE